MKSGLKKEWLYKRGATVCHIIHLIVISLLYFILHAADDKILDRISENISYFAHK